MSAPISAVSAMEILDSRGNPTVRVCCKLDNGISVLLEIEQDIGLQALFGHCLRGNA